MEGGGLNCFKRSMNWAALAESPRKATTVS